MIFSEKLSEFKNLIHGFTTREEGDFREARKVNGDGRIISRINAIAHIRDMEGDLVLGEQVHGDKIAVVSKKDKGTAIGGVDGLITKEKGVILGVTTADCLPILFFEPKEKIVAAVHAGWEGSLKRISQQVIQEIKSLGGEVAKMVVAIGPHIKSCCYDIDEKRATIFRKEFGKRLVTRKKNKSFLDLTKVNLIQLLKTGVKKENIEVLPHCTYCRNDLFFSYRKDREDYEEMLSFIGMGGRNDEFSFS